MDFVAGVFGQLQGSLLRGYGRAATVYWIAIVGAGLAAVVWSIHDLLQQPQELLLAAALAAIAGASARFSIRVGRSSIYLSIGEMVSYVGLIMVGPAAAVVCVASEVLVGSLYAARRWSGRLVTSANSAVAMAVVATIASATGGDAAFWATAELTTLLLWVGAVALAYAALDTLLFRCILHLLRRGQTERLTLSYVVVRFWAAVGPACAAALVFAGYTDYGLPFLTLSLALLGIVGVTMALASRQVDDRQRDAERSVSEARQWQEAAMTDALTGIRNRGYFNAQLPDAIASARTRGQPLAMALLDLDHFHDINVTYGWTTGDAVLQRFVQVAQAHLRSTDWLARYGGEEFAMVLPGTTLEDARAVAERLRAAVEGTRFEAVDGRVVPVTLSVGVTVLTDELSDAIALATKAGQACIEAKEGGRNRVVAMP